MRTFLKTGAPAMLILLFAYAAISKLAVLRQFRHEMHNQNFPPEAADALTFLIPAVEITAVILLLTEKWLRAGLVLSVILMTLFTGYIGLVLAGYWDRVPCSCGGVLRNMSWQAHFLFNLFFLALSLAAVALPYKGKAENLRKE
ncbi:MauE/DoxX family redox-associated membrane protein [Mucilaginibacter lutimaris]|uniref:MauE/DoxX family redox-associated membrane protein n=1 Tax=Mucilaginibacter lutimaris TaxID=931629 RepID=A0ABW2ZLV4_9SPHI